MTARCTPLSVRVVKNSLHTAPHHRWGVTTFDVVVAIVTLMLSASTAAFTATKEGEPPFTAAALGVLTLGTLALVWRRMSPAATLLVVGIAAAVYGAVDWSDPLLPFGIFVALAAVFEYASPVVKWSAWTITSATALVVTAIVGDSDALDWWTASFIVIAAPLVGDYMQARRRLVDEATARIDRLEAERLHALADARAAERTRVARELHDVVAHHITLLVVQAEAAASTPSLTGVAAQSVFDDLARGGRTAMNELRSVLSVLRSGDSPPAIAPQPTLRDLDSLVAGVESSGVKVSVEVTGPIEELPVSVNLAAYRIVQEGLTNVVKHAPGSSVDVSIARAERELAILITNTPITTPTNTPAVRDIAPLASDVGVGLIGLHERVGLLGGTFTAGPHPLGGFQLEAHIPTESQ